MLFSHRSAPVTADEPERATLELAKEGGGTGMKATETEAGRHIETEMFDAGAALAA